MRSLWLVLAALLLASCAKPAAPIAALPAETADRVVRGLQAGADLAEAAPSVVALLQGMGIVQGEIDDSVPCAIAAVGGPLLDASAAGVLAARDGAPLIPAVTVDLTACELAQGAQPPDAQVIQIVEGASAIVLGSLSLSDLESEDPCGVLYATAVISHLQATVIDILDEMATGEVGVYSAPAVALSSEACQ